MKWAASSVTDNHGGKSEKIWTARDDQGCEWMVSQHDDGTWNVTQRDRDGELLDLVCDFLTPELARLGAEKRAAALTT